MLQVIVPARFRPHAGHFESAEWMTPDERACDGAVDVKITHLHFGFTRSILAGLREKTPPVSAYWESLAVVSA